MALVDYQSDSNSDSDSKPAKPPPKKFQKVVDPTGKIIVNLTQTPSSDHSSEPPPSKRPRTSTPGTLFKNFNSFLPPPKNAASSTATAINAPARSRPGIHLKTSAEAGFARDSEEEKAGTRAEPMISEDLKPAGDVQLVGKPLMFKPLSVARNNPKKKAKPAAASPAAAAAAAPTLPSAAAPAPPKKSLFSMHVEEPASSTLSSSTSYSFSPDHPPVAAPETISYNSSSPAPAQQPQPPSTRSDSYPNSNSNPTLHTVADDLNLSPSARRELFGRSTSSRDSKILHFDMDQEYRHNEGIRAAGEQQLHNPVRAIQGGGKHSLRQLVHNVVNQRDALEEGFAKGKSTRKEAGSKYGW